MLPHVLDFKINTVFNIYIYIQMGRLGETFGIFCMGFGRHFNLGEKNRFP